MIRAARTDDAGILREVERRAGERFRDIGMPEIADAEPMSSAELSAYARAGRSWVVVDADDRPVAYAVVDILDHAAHVEQLSVEPEHQAKGWGRALIDHVETWAASGSLRALTLTTFRDVAWNRPLFEHLGFRVLNDEELTAGLELKRAREATLGLDPVLRVCMAREVRSRPAG